MRIFSTSHAASVLTTVSPGQPLAIALGNFDGVHRGHRHILKQVVSYAASSPVALIPAVASFDPHPRTFFGGRAQPLLTPLAEKIAQLEGVGIEQLVLLPFNQALAQLSPQQFVASILAQQLQTQFICVGADFRFGYQRQGTVEDLQRLAQDYGMTVAIADLLSTDTERISSSRIRQALLQGDLPLANRLLGRPYSLTGTVITGRQLGRTIGFPTANLALPADKLWPKFGVYAGWAYVATMPDPMPTVINLGDRPTVNGQAPTAEAHLLHWSGDLYGQGLRIELHHYLRPEQKFASLDHLKDQIAQDCHHAQTLLTPGMAIAEIQKIR